MINIYLPSRARILEVYKHTDIDSTFKVEYAGTAKPGQFFQISLPKIGEMPISVSDIGDNYLGFTIRSVGTVSDESHTLSPGDYLFLRGPYGNGFDIDYYKGKETVVAAGGTGLAPVKGIVDYFAAHPEESEGFMLVAGFKTPQDILFKDDIAVWAGVIKTIITVDRGDAKYQGPTGVITKFIPQIVFNNKEEAQVIVVGPPVMMHFTVQEFLKLGIKEENIWVSYERRMSCGVGKCGHCKIDDTYICLDGPVFNYTEAKQLID